MSKLPDIILLCGFSGAGKTATGKALAEKIGYPMTDTDEVVEEVTGKPIKDIFIQQGEAKFRFAENDAIRMAVKNKPRVVALGGGAIENDENVKFLKSVGTMVYLKVSTDAVYERVKEGPFRPMLQTLGGQGGDFEEEIKKRIEKILERREANYLRADLTVDTEGKTPEQVADEIIAALSK